MSKSTLVGTCLAVMMLAGAGSGLAQQKAKTDSGPMAGSTTAVLGVSVDEVTWVARGWSVKKQILGKTVFNDKNERLGKVEDVIAAPDKALSYAIVGVGGFLGVDRHDVAIPVSQLKIDISDRITLPGATKDIIKGMPQFQYAK